MANRITGAEHPLSKIFSADFAFVIPSYQRPYAWTTDQAGELFDDLKEFHQRGGDDTYFLGSIVLIKNDGNPHAEVIDGQQRITSLTILFAAIASLLDGETRRSFEKFILEPGDPILQLEAKPRLTPRERDRVFFADYIQSIKLNELLACDPAQLDEPQRNFRANTKLFLERLAKTFGTDLKEVAAFGSTIIRRCFLVAVTTPSAQSAFRVFAVLNSRGLDLLPTDIIKSKVIGQVRSDRQASYNNKWEELEVETGRDGLVELFGHIRMIYMKAKARASLLEEFEKHVIPKAATAEALVDDIIEPYADAYLIAKNKSYKASSNAPAVNLLIEWLNRIDNSDWMPVAIRFLAQQNKNSEYVLWFFTKLERLAAYMHVCARNVNERMERYAQVLTALEKDHDPAHPVDAVNLQSYEKKWFLSALGGRIYELSARRRNYLMLRLDSFVSTGASSYDSDVLTIEHVLPQTVDAGSLWETTWPDVAERDKWVHKIANLVPLTQRTNSSARNYDFLKKCTKYFTGKAGTTSYALTTQVLAGKEWTPATVEARQTMLIDKMADKWELNPAPTDVEPTKISIKKV
jgi:hypothetical protein